MPDLPREGTFTGLRNQSATCYLNSLIQSYYMSPEFRNAILTLPLCVIHIKIFKIYMIKVDNFEHPSGLLDKPSKQKFLASF
jgi:uncharacterized UBP type Zn finger protein